MIKNGLQEASNISKNLTLISDDVARWIVEQKQLESARGWKNREHSPAIQMRNAKKQFDSLDDFQLMRSEFTKVHFPRGDHRREAKK